MPGAIPPLPRFEDAATARFYEELKGRNLRFPRCGACERTFVPPRTYCSRCLTKDLAWIDAPRRGTLYCFTWQRSVLRFTKPDIIGAVELQIEGGPVRLISRIVGKYEELSIGMPLELDFIEPEAGVVLHQWKPSR